MIGSEEEAYIKEQQKGMIKATGQAIIADQKRLKYYLSQLKLCYNNFQATEFYGVEEPFSTYKTERECFDYYTKMVNLKLSSIKDSFKFLRSVGAKTIQFINIQQMMEKLIHQKELTGYYSESPATVPTKTGMKLGRIPIFLIAGILIFTLLKK